MNDYNEQLDGLFKDWKKKADELEDYKPSLRKDNGRGSAYFVEDGMVYLPDVPSIDDLWHTTSYRVAFLAKDNAQYDGRWDDDARKWFIGDSENACKNRNLSSRFIRKIANLYYGFYQMNVNGDECWYGKWPKQNIIDCFLRNPFAFIETKKQPGDARIDDSVLKDYIQRYKDFLKKEIQILDPHILVCMGAPIYEFAVKDLYNEYELIPAVVNPDNGNVQIYYLPSLKKVIVYAGHPSGRDSYKNHYEGVMWWYRQFLKTPYGQEFLSKL